MAFACLIFAAKLYGLEIIFEEEEISDPQSIDDDSELKLVRNPKFDFSYMALKYPKRRNKL